MASDPGRTTSSGMLVRRARAGDRAAAERLFQRYRGFLMRVGRGRLPHWARSVSDTADIVQDTLLRTFKRLHQIEPEQDSLRGYLCRALENRLRDELRRATRLPQTSLVDNQHPDGSPSPLSTMIAEDGEARFRAALSRLRPADQRAIVARFDLGFTYEQVAVVLDKATSEAARVAVRRAVVRLVEELARGPS